MFSQDESSVLEGKTLYSNSSSFCDKIKSFPLKTPIHSVGLPRNWVHRKLCPHLSRIWRFNSLFGTRIFDQDILLNGSFDSAMTSSGLTVITEGLPICNSSFWTNPIQKWFKVNGVRKRAQAEWPKWEKLVANKWVFHSTEKRFYFFSKQWFEL